MPHFQGKNPAKFRVWCAMAHRQDFTSVYMARIDMLILRRTEAPQSIKGVDTCHIHGETSVTGWHGLVQSHRDNCAHSI